MPMTPEQKAKLMDYAKPKTPSMPPKKTDGKGEEEGEDMPESRFVAAESMTYGDGEDEDMEDEESEEGEQPEGEGEDDGEGGRMMMRDEILYGAGDEEMPEEIPPDDFQFVDGETFNKRREEEASLRRPRPDPRQMMREAAQAAGVPRGR